MTRMMSDLVKIEGGFKPSVLLPDDFFDETNNCHFIKHYIPSNETLNIFKSIRDSFQANAEDRARLFVGTFGTGKSDLMLMIANYVTRSSNDPLLRPFFKRLYRLDNDKAKSIYQARLNKPPYLLVLLQADAKANTFSSFILNGLANTLQAKKLSKLMDKTYYQAALDLIEEWENNHLKNIERLKKVLGREHNYSLERLKSDLRGLRADSALEVFRDTVKKAIGMPFSATDVVKRPVDAFINITKKLVESKQYSGVIVIADEFTNLMEQLAKSPGAGDSKAIDTFAEAAIRSRGNQLHFYVVSLQSFASTKSSIQTSQKALERTGGRFSEQSLKSQNAEELISIAIGKLKPAEQFFKEAQGQFDDLLNLTIMLWDKVQPRKEHSWLDEIVIRGCFPLHPLTTFCLPILNRILAQNERTMFRFIWDKERGLNRFITEARGEPENGWITLFSVDKLFDYFEDVLNEKQHSLKLAYQDASRKLTSNQIEKGLEGRLLRALVMLELANQRANKEILRHAIGFSVSRMGEIELAIKHLEQASVAYPASGYYQLVKQGGVDPIELKRKIDELAKTILSSPLNTLNNPKYRPAPVNADKYNKKHSTWRQLITHFVSPNEVCNTGALEHKIFEKYDGHLCYVVSHSDRDLERSHLKAMQLTSQHSQLIIAVPHKPTDILTRLQQKHALEKLHKQADSETANLLSNNGMVGKDYITSFQVAKQLLDQPKNFKWYYDGHLVNITMSTHLSDLASKLMTNVFPATPPHRTKQHLNPNRKSTSLKNAVEKILQAPFKLPANKRKNALKSILLDGAGELGYIYQLEKEGAYYNYDVCPPNSQRRVSQKIWLLLEEELKKNTTWEEIVKILSNPPYGLYSPVLQLLLASFYHYNQDCFEIYKASKASNVSGSPLDITVAEISKIVQSPQKYFFHYQPLQENQKKFLTLFVKRALYPGRLFQLQQGETASLRKRTAQLLRSWSGKIPIVARQITEEELTKILIETPNEIISIAVILMKIATQPQEATIASALLNELPLKLGLPPDSIQWKEQELDQSLANLENACQSLKGFSKKFRYYIVQQIGLYFELVEPSEKDVLEKALKWRKEKVSGVKIAQLGGLPDGRDLISVLDENPHSFEQVFLNTLPHRWDSYTFEQWETIDISEKYLQRLKDAKEVIETKAAELGVPSQEIEGLSSQTDIGKNEPKNETNEPMEVKHSPEISQRQQVTKSASVKTSKNPITKTETILPKNDSSLSQINKSKTAKTAFEEILLIFEQLPKTEGYALWELLSNEFDPQ